MVGNTGFEPVAFRTSSGYSPAELIAHNYNYNMNQNYFKIFCEFLYIILQPAHNTNRIQERPLRHQESLNKRIRVQLVILAIAQELTTLPSR